MDSLGFAATAISSLGAISGAVQLPLPPIAGWLSDRLGRRRLLIFGYLAAAGGFLTLARSVSLWHFWVGGGLSAVAGVIAGSVGQALVTDLVPPGSLGRGLSLFEATLSVGAILGFTAGGYATESLGVTSVFVAGALLSLVATGLITLTRRHAPRSSLAKAPEGADPPDAC